MTPDRIRTLRHNLGLSAEAFARAMGVNGGRLVRRWEAGDGAPGGSAARLVEAAEMFPEVRDFLLEKAKKPALPDRA